MTECCDGKDDVSRPAGVGDSSETTACSTAIPAVDASQCPQAWFGQMIQNCLQYATAAKQAGQPIVGIMCEYTPRELILAAGGVPVCLCGGTEKTIAAAEQHLPANLCPLIKSTFGYHVQGNSPFLEMADLIVAETTCDGKKKMYELMAESRPMYVLELPHKAEDPDGFQHWLRELQKFRSFLQSRFRTEVTDAKLRDAIRVMNRERRLRRELASLMTEQRPPLTGRQLLALKSSISGIPADLQQYERALALLREMRPDGDDTTPVRVLMTGVPMAHGAEQNALAQELLERLLRENGLARDEVRATVATGYGRKLIKPADAAVTEITCQGVGVSHQTPEARTIIDIGGQDSKIVRLDSRGAVNDFAMNDRCAAGTGRFLEVVATRLGVRLQELGELAADSRKASAISSMCAVFAETEIIGLLASGVALAEIAAGVQASVATRVAGTDHA